MDKMFKPAEVAEALQVETTTVKRWLREGKLPGVKLEKEWRIKEPELKKYIEQRST